MDNITGFVGAFLCAYGLYYKIRFENEAKKTRNAEHKIATLEPYAIEELRERETLLKLQFDIIISQSHPGDKTAYQRGQETKRKLAMIGKTDINVKVMMFCDSGNESWAEYEKRIAQEKMTRRSARLEYLRKNEPEKYLIALEQYI